MPLLLRFALALCPTEFRREYGEQIAADVRQRRLSLIAASWDVLIQGMLLRCDAFGGYITYAVRSLGRSPLYAVVVVVTIATAIAANVAVVSTLEGVLFKPLPYPNAQRIVAVANGSYDGYFSYLNGRDTATMTSSFEQFGLRADDGTMLTLPSGSVNLHASLVDLGYLRVLGLTPELGRNFDAQDLRSRSAIISDRVWRRYFGASTAVVGRRVLFDGHPYTIVGVAPAPFHDIEYRSRNTDVWFCVRLGAPYVTNRGWSSYRAWALLKPGIPVATAQADVTRALETLRARYPSHFVQWKPPSLRNAHDEVVGSVASMLYSIYGAVLVLLIIACANVTNMALARVAARERELTLRTALGATRLDLVVQLGTEGALLFAVGATAGFACGAIALQLFSPYVSAILPRWDAVHVDIVTVLYVALTLLAALIVATLIPVAASRTELAAALKGTGNSSSAGRAVTFRSLLVSVEIALALTVVLAAALIVRSFVTLTHAPLGFSAEHVYVVEGPTLLPSRYKNPESAQQVDHALQNAMGSIPGVHTTSCAATAPFVPPWTTSFNLVAQERQRVVAVNLVCDGYFALLHVPLLAGRSFGPQDSLRAPAVVLVNRAFAMQYGGSVTNVLGRRIVPGIAHGDGQPPPRTVVGVVGDMRDDLATPPVPTVYAPQSQFAFSAIDAYVIGTSGADAGLADAVMRAYHNVDPFFAPPAVTPLSSNIDASAAGARLAASLFLAFSAIALILALAGIYSVTAYSVTQRTREFGIRKAVGATSAAVLGIVVQRALRQAAIGIALGLVLSAFAVRFLAAVLYQTSPFDVVAISSAVAILLACTLLAAALPAYAAMRIEPAQTLHYE